MQALKEALRDYLRGRAGMDAVREALDAALRELPTERRDDLERLLRAAHEHGLPEADMIALASRVRSAPPPADTNPDFLSTVVLPPRAKRARPPADDERTTFPPQGEPGHDAGPAASRPDEDDATVFPGGDTPGDDDERTLLGGSSAGAGDDATVFPGGDTPGDDDERTLLGGSSAGAGDDATVLRAGDSHRDADATVFRGREPAGGAGGERDTTATSGGRAAAGDDATAFRSGPARPGGDDTVVAGARRGPHRRGRPAPAGGEGDGDRTRIVADDDDRTRILDDDEPTDLDAVPPAPPASHRAEDAETTDVGAAGGRPTDTGDTAGTGDRTGRDVARDDDTRINEAARGQRADVSDDATTLNPQSAGDEDVTAVNVNADEATTVNPDGDADVTAVGASGDPDRTEVVTDAGDGFDIFAPENLAAADGARDRSGASWPTGAPPPTGAGITRDFGAGDRIRDRFELISKLGEGGMGAVWKAKDLLKEEARDRNPFVAMKLLQGDFKNHPEAFIALQRETAKQQRLAHPNIATVYDFDRDAATGTVFMTMEVLDGQPMDVVIRKLPKDGLPADEAMAIIDQLCRGLQYAHDNGLVHSDLKPGNCFLTRDNTLKLLDFGIARASKTKSDAEGETTLFDPGQLGALTPTYATLEMFEGLDPDPRDDVYALAIISYQLLTGRHPYGKKSAPKARELKLEPESIAKLDKRQNRALRRGLAFLREERTPTVAEFLEGMTPRKSRTVTWVSVGLAATLLIAALAYGPIVAELDRRAREEVVSVIQAGDLQSLQAGLERVRALDDADQRELILEDNRVIDAVVSHIAQGDAASIAEGRALLEPFPPRWQRTIMQDERARRAIIDHYERLRLAAANPAEDRYDFPAARAAIEQLKSLYPDSATVYRIETDLKTERDTLLNELGNRYNDLLAAGMLIPDPQAEDIGDVLALVRTIDPDNRLLDDDSLRFEYEKRVEQAMAAGDYPSAQRYLEASQSYAPDDPTLANLRYQVETELARIADQQRVTEIQQRLRELYPGFETLEDFQRVRDDLIRLADLDPTNPVLTEIRNSLRSAFGDALDRRIAEGAWPQAETLLLDYAKLLDIPYVTAKRRLLSEAEREAGFQMQASAERRQAVQQRIDTLQRLLAEPRFTGDWEIAFRVPYKELIALLPLGDPALEPIRNATAQLYLDRAAEAREAGRFAEALAFLDRGRTFYPGLQDFDVEQQAVAAAQEALRKQREEQERLARLERRKGDLITAAKADDVDRAKQILEELRAGLPADDAFVTTEAPRAIAESYANLARQQAADRQFDNAAALARLALELTPQDATLEEMLAAYEAEVAKRAEQLAVGKLFEGTRPLDVDALEPRLARVREQFPDDWADIARGYARSRANALSGLRVASAGDFASLTQRASELERLLPDAFASLEKEIAGMLGKGAGGLQVGSSDAVRALARPLDRARELLPGQFSSIARPVRDDLAAAIASLERSDFARAEALLAAARQSLPDEVVAGLRVEPPPRELEEALQKVAAGELNAAYGLWQRVNAARPGNPHLAGVKDTLDEQVASAQDLYRQFVEQYRAGRRAESCRLLASAIDIWSDSPDFQKTQSQYCASSGGSSSTAARGQCTAKLAGYGARRAGVCWDDLGDGTRGPELVVVPAGGGSAVPYAVGKYEVSVADYNAYCRASGGCSPLATGNDSLPVTGITLAEAQAYADWLSRSSGAEYRLPTPAEWEHAANAGGQLPNQGDLNCRVESGGTIVKGLGLVDAQSGKANGWGLVNVVGNAQEWVLGSSTAVRGGAFEDPLVRCAVSLGKPHGGGADAITGFRLVRELD